MNEVAYDRVGVGYGAVRRSEPRIAARIEAALGDAASVLNVGAGTGSYEPTAREVTAAEPSQTMIEQRPAGSAPVVQAVAEELPFEDDSFDAATAVITVHHWSDDASSSSPSTASSPATHGWSATTSPAGSTTTPARCRPSRH